MDFDSSIHPRSIQVYHLNHIGDMVFSLPLLAALRASYPNAHILSVLRPGLHDIWSMARLADEYLVRDSSSLSSRNSLLEALRKRKPDLAVILSQAWEPALFAFLTGANRRIGFHRTSLQWLLTDRVPKNSPPSVSNNLRLLEPLGIHPRKTDYVGLVNPPLSEIKRLARGLADLGLDPGKKLVVLAPGASSTGTIKEWTDEGWAQTADTLLARGDVSVAVIGTVPAKGILNLAKGAILDLTGRTTILELAALFAMTDLLIGVDSGGLHLAAAVGVPVVGIYGPSDAGNTGPLGAGNQVVSNPVECSPCLLKTCPIGRICLTKLQASQVVDAAERALDLCDGAALTSEISQPGP